MYAYRTQLTPNGRRLTLDLPPEFPAGVQKVEVVVMAEEAFSAQPAARQVPDQYTDERIREMIRAARANRPKDEKPLSDETLAWLAGLPGDGRTREEIDAQIAEERASWGED
jgi:hypothetical protein